MATTNHSTLDQQSVVTCLLEAKERKSEGNDYFRLGQWNEAIVAYQSGLNQLPRRVSQGSSTPTETTALELGSEVTSESTEEALDNGLPRPQVSHEHQIQVQQLRAVLSCNIGACNVKLGEHKEAVEACTEALKDSPSYEKALQRRAASNEVIGSWSSLISAQEDYNTLLTLGPPSPTRAEIEAKIKRIKPRIEAAQKGETSEMLDKLKGLGNSILGNFGLSTDSFQFTPNGQGGYSLNFTK